MRSFLKGLNTLGIHKLRLKPEIRPILILPRYYMKLNIDHLFRRADLLLKLQLTLEIESVLIMPRHYTKSTIDKLFRCADQSLG
jgi:hypothetical protein